MICIFEEGVCTECGQKLPKGVVLPYRRTCSKNNAPLVDIGQTKTQEKCVFLENPIGENVKLFGCGCCSEKENGFLTAIYECRLHDLCVPFPGGTHLEDSTIKMCRFCPDNTIKQEGEEHG